MDAAEVVRNLRRTITPPRVPGSLIFDIPNRWDELVKRRHDIIHSHPATVDGEQRLSRWAPKWDRFLTISLAELDAFVRDAERLLGDCNAVRLHLRDGAVN